MGIERIVACLALAACGGRSSMPPKDSDEAIHRYVDGLQRADVAAILRALADPDRLGAVIHCATDPSAIDMLRVARGDVANLPAGQKVGAIEIEAVDDGGERGIAKNDMFRGCITSEAFRVHTYTLHPRVHTATDPDAQMPLSMRVEVAELHGGWFVLPQQRD